MTKNLSGTTEPEDCRRRLMTEDARTDGAWSERASERASFRNGGGGGGGGGIERREERRDDSGGRPADRPASGAIVASCCTVGGGSLWQHARAAARPTLGKAGRTRVESDSQPPPRMGFARNVARGAGLSQSGSQ